MGLAVVLSARRKAASPSDRPLRIRSWRRRLFVRSNLSYARKVAKYSFARRSRDAGVCAVSTPTKNVASSMLIPKRRRIVRQWGCLRSRDRYDAMFLACVTRKYVCIKHEAQKITTVALESIPRSEEGGDETR